MNNRRLVQLFLLVLAIFLSFRVVPMAGEWRASLATDIERLSDRREQLEQLLESRDEWRGRLEKLTSGELTVVAGSLPGGRPEVASARLQSLLRGYADAVGLRVWRSAARQHHADRPEPRRQPDQCRRCRVRC